MFDSQAFQEARRRWRYLEDVQQRLLKDTLPRFAVTTDQIEKIIKTPEDASVWSSQDQVILNPYILSEQYVGQSSDDTISFSIIDHGMLPSPDVGEALIPPDGPQRLRALIVDQLKRQSQHTFQRAQKVLDAINQRLDCLPDWKQAAFTLRHVEVERRELEPAIAYREMGETLFLYLRTVFEDERFVEKNASHNG